MSNVVGCEGLSSTSAAAAPSKWVKPPGTINSDDRESVAGYYQAPNIILLPPTSFNHLPFPSYGLSSLYSPSPTLYASAALHRGYTYTFHFHPYVGHLTALLFMMAPSMDLKHTDLGNFSNAIRDMSVCWLNNDMDPIAVIQFVDDVKVRHQRWEQTFHEIGLGVKKIWAHPTTQKALKAYKFEM
ncbi:uncharacterized protein BKA55DRAFT_682749 [Fusarium redolens]|uniref:Uncharacterized protein n=1 Tax=Fusarium redolens TaxID=48865 RepID=A0A9P9R8W7_FUSRE|nr:uncharacterized protein BKA55DRAFT_682749 [Fusarium redolens]KAH7269663.1 hypothetical protein BKA55DRAFT_682749 [Fusarium redolens]